MTLSKDIIHSNWSSRKWLYIIEEVFCPANFSSVLNEIKRQSEFLELLKSYKIDFLSSFTETMGSSRKKSKALIMQLILTSNKIHISFLNMSKAHLAHDNGKIMKRNYLEILNTLESLLNDCEKIDEKLLFVLPMTTYSLFISKGSLKREINSLKDAFSNSSITVQIRELILSGLLSVFGKKLVKRGDVKYANLIVENFQKLGNMELERIEDLLIQYDFNSPRLFNYFAKKCNDLLLEKDSLHSQFEIIISLEDRLNSLPQMCKLRLKIEDEPIRNQLKAFYQEKKDNINQRIELRRSEIQDAKLWDDNDRMQINLSVSQLGLFIRILMERGILSKEDIGKTFGYYARHFRTPQTQFISAESLQKKSTDVEFSTARKMKGHLIGMINWLNEHYNTSNFSDS